MNRESNKTFLASTRIDLIVVLGSVLALVILLSVFLPMLSRTRETARRTMCRGNLEVIGRAMAAYRADNSGYFPFSWGPADVPEPRRKDAMASLGCLYPDYISKLDVFRCPVWEYEPVFQLHVGESLGDRQTEHRHANWVLMDSSYGYDCRVHPRIDGDKPIAADANGTGHLSRDTATGNHRAGQNVLFADGSVRWMDMWQVWSFGTAEEDIYTENPWHADTDAFISDNMVGGKYQRPSGYDDLGPSYDPYPSLHPKAGLLPAESEE